MTKAQASPEYSESWLSACLSDRVDSRSGPGIGHVTQAGVALRSSTTAQVPRQSVTLLCASPRTKERKWVSEVTEQTGTSLGQRPAVSRRGVCTAGHGVTLFHTLLSMPLLSPPRQTAVCMGGGLRSGENQAVSLNELYRAFPKCLPHARHCAKPFACINSLNTHCISVGVDI